MGKFNGVLLVSDFDDTLYGSDLRVSEENRRALDYFTGAGGIFTVATGRAHPTFAPHAASVPINAPGRPLQRRLPVRLPSRPGGP